MAGRSKVRISMMVANLLRGDNKKNGTTTYNDSLDDICSNWKQNDNTLPLKA